MAVVEMPENQDLDNDPTPSQAPAPAAADATTGVAGQLAMLADLHCAGSLTEEEFAAAKAQLLTGG